MKEHNPDNPILHEAVNGPPVQTTPAKTPKKRDLDTMVNGGFQGSAQMGHSYPIPMPKLERDFQMSIQLNPRDVELCLRQSLWLSPKGWGSDDKMSWICSFTLSLSPQLDSFIILDKLTCLKSNGKHTSLKIPIHRIIDQCRLVEA